MINESQKPVLAVDVPSGLDPINGKIFGACIEAKKDSYLYPSQIWI
ncbi:MAG: hypothetical protein KAX30_08170 [Candidatus Atribacteria bacterium]|nr:hypothetical protein [Candidatus Atribacteria bacterium]